MIANHSGHKLFFALWPDAASRAALAALQTPLAGRLVPADKLHLTMAFLGQLPASALPALQQVLAGMPMPSLRLHIDCYGYFRRPRIAWAGMLQPPAELLALQAELVARLEAAGFSTATHGEFKPHITLAREAPGAPDTFASEPVRWDGARLALVESLPDGRYLPLPAPPAGT